MEAYVSRVDKAASFLEGKARRLEEEITQAQIKQAHLQTKKDQSSRWRVIGRFFSSWHEASLKENELVIDSLERDLSSTCDLIRDLRADLISPDCSFIRYLIKGEIEDFESNMARSLRAYGQHRTVSHPFLTKDEIDDMRSFLGD